MKNLFSISFSLLTFLSCVHGQSKILEQLEANLSTGKSSVSDVLTNPSNLRLHSDKSFRELMKKHAKQEKIRLVTLEEPGGRIIVKGKIIDKKNVPLSNMLVYVYHTDNKGWYSDTAGHVTGMEGDRKHARLFGYFKTMNDGTFEFSTIHPHGYPQSDLPQHIHFEVFSDDGSALLITELLFDDDKRLTIPVRERMAKEEAIIAVKEVNGEQIYDYKIVINQ